MNIGCIVRLERNPDIEKEMKNLATETKTRLKQGKIFDAR